jgi:pyruvate,water dikinase
LVLFEMTYRAGNRLSQVRTLSKSTRREAMPPASERRPLTRVFSEIAMADVASVGGKNASLGELIRNMTQLGIAVPEGFATTAAAYWAFIDANGLREKIAERLARYKSRKETLRKTGQKIRKLILDGEMPETLTAEIRRSYRALCKPEGVKVLDVAVRSSATAEDLPSASFAGQLESYLNVRGEDHLIEAIRLCFSSLFTDRAIVYRESHGFDDMKIALSVGVQRMVRSDKAGSGVMFSLDTETGFPGVVLIDAAWGLGEFVVKGIVDPDEYLVFKPLLEDESLHPVIDKNKGAKERKLVYGRGKATRALETTATERGRFVLADDEILTLARWAKKIEAHYGRPMDMEWAKDGRDGKLYVLQARPETVHSRRVSAALKTYRLKKKGKMLVSGLAIGSAVTSGKACVLKNASEANKFPDGAVLVAEMTDPDWGPIMKRASAIVTVHGGRTSHAAIISRELGLPAIVGAAGATKRLKTGQEITVSCAEGDTGFVYAGRIPFEIKNLSIDDIPKTRTKVMLNMADPAAAFRWWRLPIDGIGLARMEFIIANHIKIHPLALARFGKIRDARLRRKIEDLTVGYRSKAEYFVDRLSHGIARLAAGCHPHPIIVRMSDFKTNEYAKLIGGALFEPEEPNPMIGWRGASRYYSEGYRDGFALECQAIRRVRDELGLANVIVMIPFCRTLKEADLTLAEMAANGLKRGEKGLEVYVMCEVPSNVVLAKEFAERFDGFSIGSNDLTQLTLGVDRDSRLLAHLFDEEDPAVTKMIRTVIADAHNAGAKVGLCGQAPSDRPAFAQFLVQAGIDSVSVTPDSFFDVKKNIEAAERKRSAGP